MTTASDAEAAELLPCVKSCDKTAASWLDHSLACGFDFRPAVSAALAKKDARIAGLEAEVERLRCLLEPFAHAAKRLDGWDSNQMINVALGRCRKIAAALSHQEGEGS